MKGKNSDWCSNSVPYDDNNLEHVTAGPDYGQPWSSSHAWIESGSREYPAYVEEVQKKILSNWVKFGKSSLQG